jgi:hypothetical protein
MYGSMCGVRRAIFRGKVHLFCNECALSLIIGLVLSCCLVWKHGKEVPLSRIFLAGGFLHIRVDVSQEREVEERLFPFFLRFVAIFETLFFMKAEDGVEGRKELLVMFNGVGFKLNDLVHVFVRSISLSRHFALGHDDKFLGVMDCTLPICSRYVYSTL